MTKPRTKTRKLRRSRKPLSKDKTCFVIMPFGAPFDRYYENIFASAVLEAELEPIRADSLFRSTQIIGDIWKLTRDATLLIADLSGKNPNVFYELGLAHAIGKPVILVSSSIDDIPFDLRSLRVLLYDKENESWGSSLQERIVKAIEETLQDLPSAVPLPFVGRQPTTSPAEEPMAHEVRRLWSAVQELQSRQAAPPRSLFVSQPRPEVAPRTFWRSYARPYRTHLILHGPAMRS